MPYTFIKRNIYLTKKVKRRVEDDGIFCSCSSTAESSAVCGKDCLCGMLMSSCSSGCKCGSSCLNKLFHQRPVKKMKLVKTEKCGSGIVADEDIKRGEFVIEYVGEARDIKRGEHLTYDYHRFVQFGADQDCHCGAAGCRRKLGIKPNKPKHPASDAALKIVARQVAATSPKLKALLCTNHVYQTGAPLIGCMGYDSDIKIRRPHNCIGQVIRIIRSLDRRSFGIVKQFDAIAKKHLIMFEDGSVEYFDLSKEDWEFCNFLV
uniref:Histone-lysine N-methyltransferase ASHH3 isoform X3 n=1 Tax=Nicotiana tabacum TaxID=4097 RepID=A0A1S3Y953_TOBAC|nr:PREDICTED: histone-lysine N-methyltransferase ASHH3-like isoform X3 [Nicotiana tabacum]